jgi:nucleoside phosphorylase
MPLVDYLLLTPLDEEWRTVRKVLVPKKLNTYQTDPITYYLWKQRVNRPPYAVGEYLIVAAPMFRRTGGEALASVITSHGVGQWKPSRVVLMGIAGSIEPDSLKLGDVVVSDEIYGYEVGDAEVGGLNFRPTFNQIGALDFDRVRAFRDDPRAYKKWQEECVEAAPAVGLKEPDRPPELHLEAIASGNFVVKSTVFGTQLKEKLSPKIKAVEMEARGLFQALYMNARRTDALMIRGISDYADDKKTELEKTTKDAWRTFAAANAARFLRTFWRRGTVQPISPDYQLDLTMGPFTRFRQAGIPNIEYKHAGGQDNAFPNLLNRSQATPELTLEVSAVAESSQPAQDFRGICIIESPKRSILTGEKPRNGIMTFQLPVSEWGMKAELLLSFPFGVDKIKVVCKDNFLRKSEAVIERPQPRR